MERTSKVKIALAVMVGALLIRCILHYLFPIPLEFAPYDAESEGGQLQTLTATDIRYVFAYALEGQKVRYFYRVHMQDGNEGVLVSYVKYHNETFEEPVTFTGRTLRMTTPPEAGSEAEEAFLTQLYAITFEPGYQQECGMDAEDIYRDTVRFTALDLSFTDTTEENPASFWFSLLAAGAFVWMLMLLLAEYFGRRKANANADDKKSEKV